jgi:outer membrane lipoprotein-sorting protein
MKRVTHLIACIFVLAGFSLAQALKQHTQARLNPTQIIEKMADTYASARSYQDDGVVQLRTGSFPSGKVKVLNTFETYFARPESYRFQWKANDENDAGWKVIWTTGNYFSTLNANGDREFEANRGITIARAAALTRGASQTVASLLTGTVNGFRVSNMSKVSLVRLERFDGETCYLIRGHHPLGFPIEIWIGKNDFLIRKIRQMNGDGSYQEEIRRNIVLDGPIPQRVFQYRSIKTAPRNVT